MKLFRSRFILLGLLLCLCHVWCLTCGTEFDDPASSAYLADIVLIGTLSQKLQAKDKTNYNATIIIKNKRNILKGETSIAHLLSAKSSSLITVGEFGNVNPEMCLTELDKANEYVFFLNKTEHINYLKNSAIPLSDKNKKDYKKGKKAIKKILCKKVPCASPIHLNNGASMSDINIQPGQALQLNCTLKRKPFPEVLFTWLKDGVYIKTTKSKKLSIKDIKNGSKLEIERTTSTDSGKYECVARHVAAYVSKSALVTVSETVAVKDFPQRFKTTLTLICQSNSKTRSIFIWKKNEQVLVNGSKEGLTIKSSPTESRFIQENLLLSDEGVYTCIDKSDVEIRHRYNVTVFDDEAIEAPKKKEPCGKEYKDYCLNNGTCERWVELDKISCVCKPEYRAERCRELSFDKARDGKLTQDRNLIIVGIISGILIFIGICVASCFLAKRRSNQFFRQKQKRANCNIEDNIPPPNYRPLIGCDDIDGFKRQLNTAFVHKEVQTTETCFLNYNKVSLYINTQENYNGNNGAHENMPRSRKTAVSLLEDPRDPRDPREELNIEQRNNKNLKNSDNLDTKAFTGQNDLAAERSAVDGAPIENMNMNMNDLSPKRNQLPRENNQSSSALTNVSNIASATLISTFDLDTDSDDDEVPCDGTPLTPLYISEGEDRFEFKKYRPKQSGVGSSNAVNQEQLVNSNSRDTNLNLPIASLDNNDIKSKEENDSPSSKSYASSNSNADSSSTTTEGCDSPNTAWMNAHEHLDMASDPPQIWNEKFSIEISEQTRSSNFNFIPNKVSRSANEENRHVRKLRDNIEVRPTRAIKSPRDNLSTRPNRGNCNSTSAREQSETRQPKCNDVRLRQPNDNSGDTRPTKHSSGARQMRELTADKRSARDTSDIKHQREDTDMRQSRDLSHSRSDRNVSDDRNNRMKHVNREKCTIAI